MTRLSSDAIMDARRLLQDERLPYRYPDTDLLEHLNQALTAAYRMRPELMVGGAWAPPAPLALTDALPSRVSDWYFGSIVSFIVGMAESRDDQYGDGSRALVFLSRLQGALQGQGV